MVISHNLAAMNANRMLGMNVWNLKTKTEKLSSGYSINRAADDAAGLAISEKMRRQIRGLDQGAENIMDGISMLQVADGALTEVHDMLQRMNELSVQAANGTNTDSDREAIQSEIDALVTEIDRVGKATSFNDRKIFQEDAANSATGGRSVFAKGKPTDTTITTYQISADATTGVTVNGTTYAWADVKNGNGDSLADALKDDTYSFTYNGMTVEIEVSASDTLDKIVEDIDGLTFETNPTTNKVTNVSMGKTSSRPLDYVGYGDDYVNLNHSGTCEITADQSGITITNKDTNTSIFLDFQRIGTGYNKSYEELMQEGTLSSLTFFDTAADLYYFEIDTQYTLTLDLAPGWTKDDVINAINGSTYETSFSGTIGDWNTSMSNKNGVQVIDFNCYFSEQFYLANGCNLEKLNIENPFVGTFVPDSVNNDCTITLVKDGYANTFQLNADGKNKLASISTTGLSAGDTISLTFEDGNGNRIVPTWRAASDINYGTFLGYLRDNPFSNYGNSVYNFSNFASATNRNYNIDLGKGANNGNGQEIRIQCSGESDDYLMLTIGKMDAETIGIQGLSVKTTKDAGKSIDTVASAISKISKQRSRIGAQQNRLEHAYNINQNTSENTQYAESQIRDTDMASLMVKQAQDRILVESGQSMLAQANQSNQYVLNLLN